MASTYYYGLKKTDGTIVQKGWTTAPTFQLYWITNASSWQNYHIFGYCNSSLGLSYQDFTSNTPAVNYSTFQFGASITRWSYVRSASVVWKVMASSKTSAGVDIGYSLTKTAAIGDTIYDGSKVQYTLCQYEVKEKYTLTVKKCLDNGTQTQVSSTQYDDGTSVTVPIPSAYSNSVLSGVLVDSGAQSYSSGGYPVTVNANKTVLFKFTSTVKITLAKGTGVSSLSGSATTSYTGVTTSANASGNFMVEKGTTISLSATASSGYVLYTNAITSSASGYGTISGSGGTTASGTKTCTVATTFTANASQYTITPSIVSHSDWGTAKINGSTGAVALKPNTTYTLSFESSTAGTLAAAVDYWSIGGSTCSTSFTTGSTVTGNLTAYLYLKQTKWQLSVANGTNSNWGSVSGGGWYASGTLVTVTFTPNSSYSQLGVQAYQINYNGSTSSCGNSATITTTNASLTATMYLKQTKYQMSLALGTSGTDGWGTISANKTYVATGEQVTLTFTPNASLVSSIHPQVDHWTFLQQTSTPTPASDGSSSVTVTLGTVSANFTAYCYLASAWRRVSIQRTDSGDANWGNFYLGASGTATTAYYAPGTQITMRFVRNTSFDLKHRPQVNAIAIGTESTISGVDGTYSYQYTLPSNVKTDLTISCSAKQTAWPVSVKSNGNGTVVAYRIETNTAAWIDVVSSTGNTATIYARYNTNDEYLATSETPNDHYALSGYQTSNLTSVGGGYDHNYRLTTAASASITGSFARSDFKITASSDLAAVCDVYMQDNATSEAYYPISQSTNPVVVCKIKAAYADQYRVTTFTIGSQSGVEAQYNSAADLYYVEVSNRSDVVVTAHVVATNFDLAVNVGPSNKEQFGTVIMSANGQQIKDLTADNFSGKIREGTHISVVFYQKYGGKVLTIQPSAEIASPVVTDYGIEFDMPCAACSVNITLGAKATYQLTVGIRNLAAGQAANIPGIVTVVSRTYPDTFIGETTAAGTDKTFTVYKDEEYSLILTPVSDYLSKRYAFIGWRDGSGAIPGASETVLNVLNSDAAVNALSRFAGYNSRDNGTITIEWAQKVNETITPLANAPSGCSLTILNDTDKYDETHWLIGNDITIPYEAKGTAYDQEGDAYKWTPVEVDVAIGTDPYAANATWDDGLLTQGGSFKMLGNMKVRVVLVQTHVVGYTTMHVGYKQSNLLMGEVSIFATEMDAYTQDSTGATVLVQKTKKAVIMAAPRPGFAFAGWFTYAEGVWTAVAGAKAVYEIDYVTSPMTTYYAQFVASTVSNVKMWNGNENVAKTCEWQSKVYVGTQFFNLAACRVYADAYPVTLKILMASSPDGVFGTNARTAEITIRNQDPRRLPTVRPEKYLAFKVTGYSRINHVGIASSMEALK